MLKIYTLKVRIPSSSHNATGEDEQGMFWPAGTQFRRIKPRVEAWYKRKNSEYAEHVFLEQIGGEEVTVAMKRQQFAEVF